MIKREAIGVVDAISARTPVVSPAPGGPAGKGMPRVTHPGGSSGEPVMANVAPRAGTPCRQTAAAATSSNTST